MDEKIIDVSRFALLVEEKALLEVFGRKIFAIKAQRREELIFTLPQGDVFLSLSHRRMTICIRRLAKHTSSR